MASLHHVQTVIVLLVAVLALTAIARAVLIPYPILLVIGGLALGLVPGLPTVRLEPDLVFLVFLPLILWSAAYFTSFRDFRANLRPITLLAVGLVLATTAAVAAAARALVPGLPWSAAVALGAIVSPPDAVAATAIARRLRIPNRVVTILEGESLVNDASALVLYRVAVTATAFGGFALGDALLQFVLAAAGGVLIGLVVGYACVCAVRLSRDNLVEIATTLVAPYVAWVVAEETRASGVLACVAGGLYVRRQFSAIVAPATRIQARAVWELVVFVLNGVIFILIGLQVRALSEALAPGQLPQVIWQAAVVSATAIGVRLVWVPLAAILPRLIVPGLWKRDPMPPWSAVFLLSWTAMRGIVSLAAALGLPLTTATGAPFPFREEIILVTFGVILTTLVLQGLTLAPIIRALRLPDDPTMEQEERRAREAAIAAALARLDEVAREPWARSDHVEQIRTRYSGAVRRFSNLGPAMDEATRVSAAAYRRLRHATLEAERKELIAMRDQGVISDEVLGRLEHELDVEALRLGTGDLRSGS